MKSNHDAIARPTRIQSWLLDPMGNFDRVTTNNNTESRAHDLHNRLTAVGSDSLTYDGNGNMTKVPNGFICLYNAWNWLVQMSSECAGQAVARLPQFTAAMLRATDP